ncbi:MAG: hypothetical protein GEU91_15925 [Rhizobiales bacterium]|nr:hypothetical protein [Hyphomicrobiales bacterium]
MIKLAEPHMALNAQETDRTLKKNMGPPYKMRATFAVPDFWTPQQIVDQILVTAQSAPQRRLGAVVLNSHGLFRNTHAHGYAGGFGIGLGAGIRSADAPLFKNLRSFVDEIYITGCEIARTTNAGGVGDGKMLCSELARNADAYVYASDARQKTLIIAPYGCIDGFEGSVFRWGRDGTLLGSRNRWRTGAWDGARWLHVDPY